MKTSKGRTSYASVPQLNKKYLEECSSCDMGANESGTGISEQLSLENEYPHQIPTRYDLYGGPEFCSELIHTPIPELELIQTPIPQPELNIRSVLTEIYEVLTGRNRGQGSLQCSSSEVSFLSSGNDGESYLHPSVYLPSAPPLPELGEYGTILESEPPEWIPDSYSSTCMQCNAPFRPLTRGRHHCRFCGGLFCGSCTKGRCLLPIRFHITDPQRVCDVCYDKLDPFQGLFINYISNAAQTAKHDVIDWTCPRGWINLPIGLSMEDEIYKATSALRTYCQVARLDPENSIPRAILKGASGLAILTAAKVGAVFTYKLGTGLIVARRRDGSWSAPSAILSFGLGWGAQIGGELTDFIVVLHGPKSVETFCNQMHFCLGAGLSAAAGPVGRAMEVDFRAGNGASGMSYTYSCSKGAFIGASLEGNVVMTRMNANQRFYGDPYLATNEILLGNVERPRAAEPLYSALEYAYANLTG